MGLLTHKLGQVVAIVGLNRTKIWIISTQHLNILQVVTNRLLKVETKKCLWGILSRKWTKIIRLEAKMIKNKTTLVKKLKCFRNKKAWIKIIALIINKKAC